MNSYDYSYGSSYDRVYRRERLYYRLDGFDPVHSCHWEVEITTVEVIEKHRIEKKKEITFCILHVNAILQYFIMIIIVISVTIEQREKPKNEFLFLKKILFVGMYV